MINLGILTATAFANGLNPCGIGLLITFLGYLLVFGNKGKDNKYLWKTGAVYIGSVFVTYLLMGLLFYGVAYYLQRWWLASVFKYIIGGAIIIAGLIQVKDVFWDQLPFHLRMPMKGFEAINKLMSRTGYGITALIGVLTTAFSSPCMLPLYIGTTAVIARSGLPMVKVLGYFLYYNLIFVLPLFFVLGVMASGREVVEMKEWEHKNTKWMRFVLGFALVAVGILIIKK